MEQRIKKANINYYDRNEFVNIEEIGELYKANWKKDGKLVTLKSFKLDDDNVREIAHEIKLRANNDINDVMMELYGITKNSSDNYLLVVEYAEGGTLRNYLEKNFLSLKWRDKYELVIQLSGAIEFLHEGGIVHKDLHSGSILVHQNSIKLADSGLNKRIKDSSQAWLDTIPYTDPRRFDIEEMSSGAFELNEKSDVYSVGVLLWELSSGKKPFSDKEYNLFLAREITQGLREAMVDGTPNDYYTLYERCWNGDPDKRPTIRKVITALKLMISSLDPEYSESSLSKQKQIIQQFNLNHGLFLNGYNIEPSKQAVFTEDGELNMSLYEGQPLVYTSINDRNSRINLLDFNSDDNDVQLDESLQPSDICINFPVAEITYTADLSKTFSNFINDDRGKLYEMYGHHFPRKIFIGGKLFIDGLKSFTSTQIDIFITYLTWIYNTAKYEKEIPFNNLSALNFFPKILTPDGINLDNHKKLTKWMNDLYQDDTVEIISYNNLVPIYQLKSDTISLVDEIQPGVANFKEKLTLENWVKNTKYIRWVKEFQLHRGLIIDKKLKLKISKENAIDLINIPNVNSSNKFCLSIVKPTTTLDDMLIDNNVFSDNEDISSFPFIKVSDDLSHEDYAHFLVKCEQYKVLLNRDNIKPSEKFKLIIERALENMKPHIFLQEIFENYGHFIPLSIILGKSLKNTIENSSYISKRIDLESPVFESLKSHLADFSIPCLLTQKGDIIEKNGLSEWIQNINNDLEIIEFNNIIPLYDILEVEQKKEIDIILNKRNNFRIIMTGSIDLKYSDITKQLIVGIRPPVEKKNYEIFGSIVSKNNSKLKDIFVTFGSYEIDQFTATIRTSKKINIKDYYILWMMIGNPSELSVFGPNNREIQVEYVKQSIKLQRNNSYSITTHQLSQGYDISIKCFKPIEIKFAGWSKNCVHLNISNPKSIKSDIENVEIAICVLNSGHEKSWIDINAKKYSIGCILTENNYLDIVSNAQKYLKTTYPTKNEREKETMLVISKKNLENHLDLSEFVNLEKLNCSGNDLTSLDISKNKHLTEIDCSQNKIISLDLSNCLYIKSITANCNQLIDIRLPIVNSEKLEYLNLLDNSFSQNLNYFSRFVNLKELLIGSIDGDRIQQGKFNKFYGSMKPLKSMIKLKSLSINNTDIDSGLEFLPDCITNFRCLADKRSEAKVKKIYDQLGIYTLNSVDAFQGRYNLKAWKENWKTVKEKEALLNQIKQIEELTSSDKLNELEKEESNLIAKEVELVEKNNHLEVEIKNLEQVTNNLKQLVNELNAKLEQKEVAYQQTKEQLEEKEEKLKSFTGEKLENFTTEKLMEKEELNKEIGNLKKMLLDKEKDVEQSEKQLEEINTELETKEKESDNLKNELDNIKSSLTEIQNKKAELSKLKKKLEHEKKFSKTGTSGLRKQMDDLKKELQSLKNQEIKAKELKNELEEIRRNKNRLQNEKAQQQDIVEDLQKEQTNLQENLKNLNNKLKEKEGLINKLEQQKEQQIKDLQNKLEDCLDKLKNKEELIEELQNKFDEEIRKHQENLSFLNSKLKNKEKLIEELQNKLDEETKKYHISQEDLASLNNKLKNKEKFIEELQSKLDEETKKYQISQENLASLNNELKNKEEIIEELQNNLNEETRKYQISQENLASLNDELKNKGEIIEELQNNLNEEIRKYQISQENLSSLNNELKNKEEIIEELQNKLDEETKKYQENLASLNSKLKNKEKLIEELQNNLNEETKKYQISQENLISLNNELENREELIEKLQSNLDEETRKYQVSQENITSLNNQLKNKEGLINELQQQGEVIKNRIRETNILLPQIQTKNTKLKELIDTVKKKDLGKKGKLLIDNMLEKHKNFILGDNDSASKELEKINQKLIEDYELTNKEINEILNTHEEVIRFDIQLTSLLNPESE
ncbi:uncharacterized protein OCT59_006968 [Rhizophagus irregularis]|uniref:Cdc15p n=2 Tax=Rhizophagus irregularis TaxID=588596 RepID=A0A015L013_RHIIW|nr:hypothetical protein GLOIN_2v1764053 [Rhizophagus irregularis DAOM 181602=DAOM 197198]EXX73154.1 Cdc15p [Rhizophagus irregularis DAOM 197198w]POG80807.1 hypothetical protein GLOIN_2v1764053 [Rhizophagus irregularis DAOM 181602=DAOM 197198]UZO15550.1 hypothetical protein OCT59_006968 [Rhizophagus irregularis]|eukprot:XP_025187673.1 hypothetical protein GLOIN_2v1764053 [Rhizophagus irregularis DAOM 181602=DAOM 197198]